MNAKNSTLLAIAALILALGSIAIQLLPKTVETGTAPDALERMEELEREISYLRGQAYRDDQGDETQQFASVPQIDLRDEKPIRTQQNSLNQDVEEMRWTMTVRGLMPPTEQHLQRSRDMIFSEETSVEDKLVALRILKSANMNSDEIVVAMIDTYYKTSEHDLQAEIFNVLDGVDTPELVQVLLDASSNSPSSRVRREAIDALSGYLPDPDLNEWLIQVEEKDKDKRVRREAERLIKKHKDDY